MRAGKLALPTIRRVALAWPGVEEGTSYGTPAFRLKGKLIARLHQDGSSIMFKLGFEAREHLMQADPRTLFVTEHYRDQSVMTFSRLTRRPSTGTASLRELGRREMPKSSRFIPVCWRASTG